MVAEAVGDELVTHDELLAPLKAFFASRNVPWTESNARQAQVPTSGAPIDNPNGTAPGLHVSKNGKTVLALPGPKGEFNPMANGPVREILRRLGGEGVIHSRTLRVIGIGESAVEAQVRDAAIQARLAELQAGAEVTTPEPGQFDPAVLADPALLGD